MVTEMTAATFVERLEALQSPEQRLKYERSFRNDSKNDVILGVPMGQVFALAQEFIDLPPRQIERLMESDVHEARAGALSVMDKQARRRNTPEDRRRELYNLYLRRMDRIDNWDLVDLGAPFVIGGYLHDYHQPRDILYVLARSDNPWERRTAMYATSYFIRKGELDDTFRLAELLVDDEHDLVRKAVGAWLREAGKQDPSRLLAFLDRHAATMPRVTLRYAIEKLDPDQRAHYLGMKQAAAGKT